MEKPSGILKACRSSIVNSAHRRSSGEGGMDVERDNHKVLISAPAEGMDVETSGQHSHSMVDENHSEADMDTHYSSDEFTRKRKERQKL